MPRPRRPRLPRPGLPDLAWFRREAGPPRPPLSEEIYERLKGFGYAIDDGVYTVGRVPTAVGRGAREFWFSLSIYTRRRLGVVGGLVAAAALIAFVAVPALPCAAPGGDVCPPSDDAIHLVPQDALAYVHMNVDPGTEQFQEARKVAARVPTLTQQVTSRLLSRLPGPGGSTPDFGRDIQPWFGGEAALAIVPAGAGTAEEVELLEVSNADGAKKYVDSIATGKPRTSRYRNVDVQVDRRGLATALVGGFLAIGRESGVRAVIDAQSGAPGTGSLAGDPTASAARDALPAKRVADVYLSPDGISSLIANPNGPLSTFGSLVNPGASKGVAVALVASDQGLDVDVRSELDPARAKAHPGFFSAFPSFKATLASSLPPDSLGYVGVGDPGGTLKSLLTQATSEEPGLAAAAGAVLGQIKSLGNVNLQRDLLPALGGEAAFSLEPAGAGASAGKGAGGKSGVGLPQSQTPFVLFLGTGVDASRTGSALAGLEAPLAKALSPSAGGGAPAFSQRKVGDVTEHSLQLSPSVDLTYAIVASSLVVATDPAGVAEIATGQGGLGGSNLYKEATAGLPSDTSALAYLNLGGLIALAERAGLAQDPAYVTFAPEIRKLEALGLAVQSSPDELSTDLRLIVGESPASAAAPGA